MLAKRCSTGSPVVVCGLPGDVEHENDPKDYRTGKVGGQAVLPGASFSADLAVEQTMCRNCGASLVLVAQVSAPFRTARVAVSERVLMLWGCISQPCANDASSWRAFSCHLPSSMTAHNITPLTDAENASPHGKNAANVTNSDSGSAQQQLVDVQTDSWGTADDSWGACTVNDLGAEQQADAAFDFSDLENALSRSQQQFSTKASKQRSKDTGMLLHSQQQQQQNVSSCCLNLDLARPSVPGFYLHMTTEAAGAPASNSADDQHIADLVAAYQDETHQAGASPSQDPSGDDWSAEAYEEDKESAFHKFCALVQRVPQQCIRYSWGGTPLWPKKQKPSPGPCLHCGAQQVFEMQILAPLMHFLEETCTWALDDQQDCSSQIEIAMQALLSWQWLTIAVFSCSNGCLPQTKVNVADGQGLWIEQTIMIASEE